MLIKISRHTEKYQYQKYMRPEGMLLTKLRVADVGYRISDGGLIETCVYVDSGAYDTYVSAYINKHPDRTVTLVIDEPYITKSDIFEVYAHEHGSSGLTLYWKYDAGVLQNEVMKQISVVHGPSTCPVCHRELMMFDDKLYCVSEICPANAAKALSRYISIVIGEPKWAYVGTHLANFGIIESPAALYFLREEEIQCTGMHKTEIPEFVAAVRKTRGQVQLSKYLMTLGSVIYDSSFKLRGDLIDKKFQKDPIEFLYWLDTARAEILYTGLRDSELGSNAYMSRTALLRLVFWMFGDINNTKMFMDMCEEDILYKDI